MSVTKLVLLGGFLGAGKTTLIGELARRYQAAGKRVGIITNDQADDLVDTMNLRSQGFDVGEVAGACFCCSFDNLVATADKLVGEHAPDVLLAEPVGSCTDLVATVVLPLQNLLGERFELAPFGVLLKPSHGRRILASKEGSASGSGFSKQAEYIFRKQLEEADYLMIGRRDQLSEEEMEALTQSLAVAAPDVPIVAVSPVTGEGVEEVLGYIESPMQAGRRLLEIDYDVYAAGEAELGWVNLAAHVRPDSEGDVDLDAFAKALVETIASSIRSQGEIAHLKVSVSGSDTRAVANLVSNDAPVDLGLASGRRVGGSLDVIVNARVAMDPESLRDQIQGAMSKVCNGNTCQHEVTSSHALRPGRPTPTHRASAMG